MGECSQMMQHAAPFAAAAEAFHSQFDSYATACVTIVRQTNFDNELFLIDL